MARLPLSISLSLVVVLGASSARAEPVPTPFDGFFPDVADAFTGTSLLFHGGALAATGTMAFSGADHALRVAVQRHLASSAYGETSVYAGVLAPLIVAPGVYFVGLASGDRESAGAGAAALQALGITFGATSALKWATGRPYPLHGGDPHAPDRLEHPEYARAFSFQPFTLDRGLAWPSGHTSAPISVAAALGSYYRDSWWVPAVGYPISLAIGFGMVVGDHHWSSDVVAGALIGHAVGWSVGRNFARVWRRCSPGARCAPDTASSLVVRPMPGATGLTVGGAF